MGLLNWLATGEWSDPPEARTLPSGSITEERALDQTTVTDIGVAFDAAIAEATGVEDSAIPAVYRSTQMLTDVVASLRMDEVAETTGMIEDEAPPLLRSPNPAETYHTSLSKIMASLLFRGNAYLWPRTRDRVGNITSVIVLHPDEVSVQWNRAQLYPEYQWRGQRMRRDHEIVHIPLNSWPGRPDGVSPISAARLLLAGVKAEQNFQRVLFEDNATPSGILHVAGKELTQTEAEEVRDIWESKHKGRKRPAVTSGSVEFKPMTIDPVDTAHVLDVRPAWETARIRNDIQLARVGGIVYQAEDIASIDLHDRRTHRRLDFQNNSQSEIQFLAERMLAAWKDNRYRVESVAITGNDDPANEDLNRLLWDTRFGDLLALRVSTRGGEGWEYELLSHVMGIEHQFTTDDWIVVFALDDSEAFQQ